MRHPQRDAIANEVRSWYRSSFPEMGMEAERRRYGYYVRNLRIPGFGRLVLSGVHTGNVTAALTDAREYFGGSPFEAWIEDPDLDTQLRPALIASGGADRGATTYLAHVGAAPAFAVPADVVIEPVTAEDLDRFVRVKLKGFANSDDEPAPEAIARETAARDSDMKGVGRFRMATVRGEPAAIIGYYDGNDVLVFNLATRVPFRGRQIATALLYGVIGEGYRLGRRSTIINTNPEDTPINWYRRAGFTDEVYWHRTWRYAADSR